MSYKSPPHRQQIISFLSNSGTQSPFTPFAQTHIDVWTYVNRVLAFVNEVCLCFGAWQEDRNSQCKTSSLKLVVLYSIGNHICTYRLSWFHACVSPIRFFGSSVEYLRQKMSFQTSDFQSCENSRFLFCFSLLISPSLLIYFIYSESIALCGETGFACGSKRMTLVNQ